MAAVMVTSNRQTDIGDLLLASVLSEKLPRRRRSKRGPHDILASRVIFTELAASVEGSEEEIAAHVSKLGVRISAGQLRNYRFGRFTPQTALTHRMATALDHRELQVIAHWPWKLLSGDPLSMMEITRAFPALKPALVRSSRRPKRKVRKLHEQYGLIRFPPSSGWLRAPLEPNEFWMNLALLRAAEVAGDVPTMNINLWFTVSTIASIAMHRAVKPHLPWLLFCVQGLSVRWPPHTAFFSTDWDVVTQWLESGAILGGECGPNPFLNVFEGNVATVGHLHTIRELHERDALALVGRGF